MLWQSAARAHARPKGVPPQVVSGVPMPRCLSAFALVLCMGVLHTARLGARGRTGLGLEGLEHEETGVHAHVPEGKGLDEQLFFGPERMPGIRPGIRFATGLPQVEGIHYAAKVASGLYRGSSPKQEGIDWLAGIGVRTVVNLRKHGSDKEQELVEAAGMRYVWLPLSATKPPADEQVAHFFDIVDDRAAHPIYVHCLHGVDRTGTMIALFRIRNQGWRNSEALAEMAHFGDHNFKKLRSFVSHYAP